MLEGSKKPSLLDKLTRRFFWRTTDQSEIDYLEDDSVRLSAWEIKSNAAAKVKIPVAFTRAYPEAETGVVTPENYSEFICEA
jgi:hypothetical protein